MWGGRFADRPDDLMEAINASIGFDRLMYTQDIAGSNAHARMLHHQGIITAEDRDKILSGLDTILSEIDNGQFEFRASLEDIHMNIESRLAELIGLAAGRLHTARSRNDQVATDFRLYVRDAIDRIEVSLSDLQQALATRALDFAGAVMPGFTHLQSAQPVTFGHHLLAYVEMTERDRGRFLDARKRLNECPLGAAALAGTSFPIDRHMTASDLGFDRPTANSLDSVSDRDFALETLSVCSLSAMHLSRLAEEIVIWCTAQFRFVSLSDRFSTGSSIMPQKRNPDAAELVRAKVGRIMGAHTALMTVMKGLPLTYSKDMQEDKEPTFDALASYEIALAAMTGMMRDLTPNLAAMKRVAGSGYSTATDFADWLVRETGMPFREAHHLTGRAVAVAEARGVDLAQVPIEDFKAIDQRIDDRVYSVLSVDKSVASRTSYGGTAPRNVRQQAKRWLSTLNKRQSKNATSG